MVEFSESAIQEIRQMPQEIIDPNFSEFDFHFKLLLLGDSAVGKSCLMHRVKTNEFLEEHKVTEDTTGVNIGGLTVKLESHVFKLQIWDPAVQESFKSITKIFYRGASCVCLCYDITRMNTFLNLEMWIREAK